MLFFGDQSQLIAWGEGTGDGGGGENHIAPRGKGGGVSRLKQSLKGVL